MYQQPSVAACFVIRGTGRVALAAPTGWSAEAGAARGETNAKTTAFGGLGGHHDAKEVFFWGREVAPDDPDVLAGLPLVHPNQWPDRAASFLREGILPYYEAVMALGLRVLTCLARGLGADPDIFVRL